ncbi:MAG: fused MFS/spermidine synthase [Planctomycetes bacterium]|nr:fused MFS/spermidine synthase [Planctomycetota bacterium]
MPGSEIRADFWMNEYITPWDIYAHGITSVLAYRRTAFQEMYIVETGAYGKALVLDGKWQSSTGDEFLYHEPLVQPAMLLHGGPGRVLILGGGEGATAREVLRWKSVERVVMIDIDGEVVDACREHLAEMHQGAFDDPRVEVRIQDALDFLDATTESWDVVISDLSDPIEDGPSFKLFTKEYFERVRRVMAADGVFVIQAGPVGPVEMRMHVRLVRTVMAVFEHVQSYTSHVPSYASPWGFALGSSRPIDARPDPDAIDRQLAEHTNGGLRMLDGSALLGMFQIAKHIRRAIAEETHIYTLAAPPKFFGKGAAGQASSKG